MQQDDDGGSDWGGSLNNQDSTCPGERHQGDRLRPPLPTASLQWKRLTDGIITFGVFILSATIRSHFSLMHMQRNNNLELYLYYFIILHLKQSLRRKIFIQS